MLTETDYRHPLLIHESNDDEQRTKTSTKQFGSKFGAVVSFVGCMVGCGNVWRFPRIAARASGPDGALMFVLVWLLFMVLWSAPMILIEYAIGRYTQKGVVPAYRELMGYKLAWCGGWIQWVSYAVMSYFCVIVGWCLYYIYACIAFELPTTNTESLEMFYDFTEDSSWPVLTLLIVVLICGLATWKGAKTIEMTNMVLVPLLLLIIISTFIWSLTREYAARGVAFMFTPDFSVLANPDMWVDAATQSAFDTGAGMGLMVAYASYMPTNTGIVKYSIMVPVFNNMVSLLCGMTTFSTAFSSLLSTNATTSTGEILTFLQQTGPGSTGLTFVWIPVLFASAGDVVGRVFAVLFFISLCSAGISSFVSATEQLAKTIEDFGVPRIVSVVVTMVVFFIGGLGSAMSLEFLTNQDFVWAFALMISGLFLQALVIKYGTKRFRSEIINDYSTNDWHLPVVWEWFIKVICPLEAIFLIGWWAVNLIIETESDGRHWYEISTESFFITIIEWVVALAVLILVNVLVIVIHNRWQGKYDLFAAADNKPFISDIVADDITEQLSTRNPSYTAANYGSVATQQKTSTDFF